MEIRQKPMGSFTKEKETAFVSKQMKNVRKPPVSFIDMLNKEIEAIKEKRV